MRRFYYADFVKGHKFNFLPRLVQFHFKICAQRYFQKKKKAHLRLMYLSVLPVVRKWNCTRQIVGLPWVFVPSACRSWWLPGTSASWSSSSPRSSSTWWRTSSTRSLRPMRTPCGGARWVWPGKPSTSPTDVTGMWFSASDVSVLLVEKIKCWQTAMSSKPEWDLQEEWPGLTPMAQHHLPP